MEKFLKFLEGLSDPTQALLKEWADSKFSVMPPIVFRLPEKQLEDLFLSFAFAC